MKPRSARYISDSKVAVAYVRVSTDDQRLGPEAQRAAIEAWALREGITVAAWRVEQGIGGGVDLDDRPGLGAALADLRVHCAGLLVVAKRDRLARDLYIAATIERAAAKSGARIVTADGTGNGDDDSSALLRGMLDVIGAHERRIIRSRTKAALAAKIARGERVGAVRYGFRLGGDGATLVPNEEELRTIREARRLRAEGLSFRAVHRTLVERGVKSRTGAPIALKSVYAMIVVDARC